MKHEAIQSTLDRCLLTNEEMELKPEIWLDKWEAEDKIGLAMEDSEDEEDEVLSNYFQKGNFLRPCIKNLNFPLFYTGPSPTI